MVQHQASEQQQQNAVMLQTLMTMLTQQQQQQQQQQQMYAPTPSNMMQQQPNAQYNGQTPMMFGNVPMGYTPSHSQQIPYTPSNAHQASGLAMASMFTPSPNHLMAPTYLPQQQSMGKGVHLSQPPYITEEQRADLFSKCRNNRHTLVEELFASGVPVDTVDMHGHQPIHIACQNNSKRLVKACLRWGADINAMNLQGNTPLHYCFAYHYDVLANYLLTKGAATSIRNYFGLSPSEGLRPADRDTALKMLRMHMAGVELSDQQIAVVLGEAVG